MITFILSLVVLILGYIFYSRFIEKYFGAEDRIKTPALRLKDGVDFIPMPVWKMFTIEFLNIAGLGRDIGSNVWSCSLSVDSIRMCFYGFGS